MTTFTHETIHTLVWTTYPWELQITRNGDGIFQNARLIDDRTGSSFDLDAVEVDALREIMIESRDK